MKIIVALAMAVIGLSGLAQAAPSKQKRITPISNFNFQPQAGQSETNPYLSYTSVHQNGIGFNSQSNLTAFGLGYTYGIFDELAVSAKFGYGIGKYEESSFLSPGNLSANLRGLQALDLTVKGKLALTNDIHIFGQAGYLLELENATQEISGDRTVATGQDSIKLKLGAEYNFENQFIIGANVVYDLMQKGDFVAKAFPTNLTTNITGGNILTLTPFIEITDLQKLNLFFMYSKSEDTKRETNSATTVVKGLSAWGLGANAEFVVVENFSFIPQVTYSMPERLTGVDRYDILQLELKARFLF